MDSYLIEPSVPMLVHHHDVKIELGAHRISNDFWQTLITFPTLSLLHRFDSIAQDNKYLQWQRLPSELVHFSLDVRAYWRLLVIFAKINTLF